MSVENSSESHAFAFDRAASSSAAETAGLPLRRHRSPDGAQPGDAGARPAASRTQAGRRPRCSGSNAPCLVFPRSLTERVTRADGCRETSCRHDLGEACVILCKLSPVRQSMPKAACTYCWETCQAVCMYSVIINHQRAHRYFVFCGLK